MAQIIASRYTTTGVTTTTSFTAVNPVHQADDYLFAICGVGSTGTVTPPAGWTVDYNNGGAGRTVVCYIKATGSSTANPVFTTTGAGGFKCKIYTIRDADLTTFKDVSGYAGGGGATTSTAFPTITPTNANCLVFTFWTGGIQETTTPDSTFLEFFDHWDIDSEGNFFVSFTGKDDATITPSNTLYQPTSSREVIGKFAIKNAAGGAYEPQIESSHTHVFPGGMESGTVTVVDLQTRVTTIDTATVGVATSISTSDLGSDETDAPISLINTTDLTVAPVSTVGNYSGIAMSTGGVDLSGQISFYVAVTGGSFKDPNTTGMFFEDGSGNWAYRQIHEEGGKTYICEYADLPLIDSSGTLDLTNITYIGFGFKKQNTNTSTRPFSIARFLRLGTTVYTGGSAKAPVNGRRIAQGIAQSGVLAGFSSSQGVAQDVIVGSVQIGDGSTATYYKGQGSHLEYRVPDREFLYLDQGQFSFNVKASASDTIDFSNSTIASFVQQNFTIDATSSTSATYNFESFVVQNYDVTWKTGVTCDGASFIGCPQIDAKGASFDNCSIIGTTAGSTEAAISFDTNGSMTGTTINVTDTSAGYHIETQSGVTAYTFNSVTFVGTPGTDKIHALRTTDTVTYTANDTTLAVADVTSEGATISVVSGVPVSVTVLDSSGSPLQNASVYLKTSGGTVVLNGLTDGSGVVSGTFTGTTPAPIDTTVSQVRYGSFATPYQAFTLSGSISGSGYDTTALMIEDE